MYQEIIERKRKIAVIGLGYVGLPIALEFAKHTSVVGFDIKEDRVEMMRNGIDPSAELSASEFEERDILFTSNMEDLKDVGFYIVAVPTPIDEHNAPELTPLLKASETVGKVLKQSDYVVYESTVYPGCTEEDCVPILEEQSGLKFIKDFKVGFSPERINPGDKINTLSSIVKVVSGCDAESCEVIAKVYELVIKAGIHRASSIKVAEAAKIIENTQRDINIAFMNELSMIFDLMNINTYEVLKAAGTKWNFLKFYPGLVGGHCIGVDPYYLTYKAKGYGFHARIINAGRAINDGMGEYVANQIVKKLLASNRILRDARVLILGITFKEDVSDIRNSKVVDLIRELQSYRVETEVIDPYASANEVMKEYNLKLSEKPTGEYDAVIVAVNHKEYRDLEETYFTEITNEDAIFVDIKGIYQDKINKMQYWSL